MLDVLQRHFYTSLYRGESHMTFMSLSTHQVTTTIGKAFRWSLQLVIRKSMAAVGDALRQSPAANRPSDKWTFEGELHARSWK